MDGVRSVTQVEDDRIAWVAEIGGVRRRWEARILEQVPDRTVAWAATEGTPNAGGTPGGRTPTETSQPNATTDPGEQR